jgi:hypothetical protein
MNKSIQPLFGHAWELTIDTAPDEDGNGESIVVSSSSWDPESLRITFDVNLLAYKALWFAKISIYNMNAPTAQKVLTQGMTVTLKAGYQTSPYGVIFRGQIYQPMWEREGVIDSKLTLMCYTGLKEAIGNFAAFRGSAFSSQAALVAKMAASSYNPIAVGSVDTTTLSKTNLTRARPFFGDPNEFFDRVAAANNMQSWMGFDGINIGAMQSSTAPLSTITYTPTTGIIGTPQQTEDGVQLDVLLDARLQVQVPPMQIKIDNAVIRQLNRYPGTYPGILDKDGLYIVMGLNFRGDSRGNEWLTRIVACTSVGGKLALLADAGDPSTPLDLRSIR